MTSLLESRLKVDAPDANKWDATAETITAHYSSLTLHRKCPEAWYFRYELGLGRPIMGAAPELYFGSWFGALRTAEALARGRRHESLIFRPSKFSPIDRETGPEFDQRTVTPQEIVDAAKVWWASRTPEDQEEWRSRLGEGLPERLVNSYVRWRDEWAEAIKHERPLGLEVFWKRKLPRPTADSAWEDSEELAAFGPMPDLELLGYIDELYYDTSKEIVVVRDNKTSKGLAQQSAADDMMDSQLALYAWGVTPQLHTLNVSPPRAMSFDRMKSTAPTEPRLNLNGSLSAQVTQFDLRTYMDWAKTDTRPEDLVAAYETQSGKSWDDLDPDRRDAILAIAEMPAGRLFGKIGEFNAKGQPKFGVYQIDPAMIEKLSAPTWKSIFFQRTLTPVSRHMITAHLRAAVDTATDIWRTKKRAEISFEAARNLSNDNCRWCDYSSLCRSRMFGGADGSYDLREHNLRSKDGFMLQGGSVFGG